jgi:hypothetical protein
MRGWFLGNEDAVHFAALCWVAAQEWDDLEDEGKADHNGLISWMAFGKEYHPYFRAHADFLRPLMVGVYLQWTAANVLDREDVTKSYMLRAGIYGLFHAIAWIEGGNAHATKVGPEIYRTYAETLEDLREELCPSR